jgi:hypothetical protein
MASAARATGDTIVATEAPAAAAAVDDDGGV